MEPHNGTISDDIRDFSFMTLDPSLDPNRLFRVKLGKGEAVLRILLSQKDIPVSDTPTSSTRRKHVGTTRTRRPDDELIVRRRPSGAFVNFYDMGQIRDGDDWIDLPFSVPPDVNLAEPNDTELITGANWDSLRDLLLTPAVADWATYYRKLEYEEAERYGLDVFDGSTSYPVARNDSRIDLGTFAPVAGTRWTSQGLNLPAPITALDIQSFGAFTRFTDNSFCKITNSPTYASSAVSFELQNGDDVFLTPNMTRVTGNSEDGLGLQENLIGSYTAMKRTVWLPLNYNGSGYPLMSYGDDPVPSDVTDLTTIAKNDPETELWNLSPPSQEMDPTIFPRYANNRQYVLHVNDDTNYAVQPGIFLGAVKRGATVFYFWSSATYENFVSTRIYTIP